MILKKNTTNYIYVIMFLLCCIKLIYNAFSVYDISLVDEHSYLLAGINHEIHVEYGPLYSLWYYLLSFFTKDNIQLMFLNFSVLSVIYPIVLFYFFKKIKLHTLFAFTITFFVLIGDLNMPIGPKVVIFMNILQLIILIVALNKNNNELRNIIIAFLLFTAYYIRPEYKLTFMIFALYMVVNYGYQFFYNKQRPQNTFLLILLIAFIILTSFFVGFPFKNQNGKMLLAFGQHFSVHYTKWNNLPGNPWTNWPYHIETAFGKISSPIQAISSNPPLFFKHITTNIIDYLWMLIHVVLQTFIPVYFIKKSIFSALLFFALFASLIYFYFRNFYLQIQYSKIVQKAKQYYFLFFVIVILLLPNLISVFVITPRWHYVALQIPIFAVLLAVVAIILSEIKHPEKQLNGKPLLVFATVFSIILLVLTPFPIHNQSLIESFNAKKPCLTKINIFKEMKLSKTESIYALNSDLMPFAYKNAQHYHYVAKQMGNNNVMLNINFNKLMDSLKINFVYVNDEICQFEVYKNDQEWKDFLINYKSKGFLKLNLDSTDYCLISTKIINNR